MEMLRQKLALYMLFAVVIPFALHANLKTVAKEAGMIRTPSRSEVTDYERRLKPVREMLPKDGVVGFVTHEAMDPLERTRYLYLTQLSLCPLIVAGGKEYRFVITYGPDGEAPAGPRGAHGLTLVKDFHDGIRLYRNSER